MCDQRVVLELVDDLKAIVARNVRLRDQRLMDSVGDAAEVFGRLPFAQIEFDEGHGVALSSR
jgi:hypothetical protein